MWFSLQDLICRASASRFVDGMLSGIANLLKLTQIIYIIIMHQGLVSCFMHGYVVTGEVVGSMQTAQESQTNKGLNMGSTG